MTEEEKLKKIEHIRAIHAIWALREFKKKVLGSKLGQTNKKWVIDMLSGEMNKYWKQTQANKLIINPDGSKRL